MMKYIALGLVLLCVIAIAGLAIWRPAPAPHAVSKILTLPAK